MNNKKEYTLKINGVDKGIKEVTKLVDVVTSLDGILSKTQQINISAGKGAREHTKALTEEEKAAKKLADTMQKAKAAQNGANDAQIKANQALREATREATLRVQAEIAEKNSIEAMRIELSQLKDEWKKMEVGTDVFNAKSEEIRVLNDRIKEAEMSTGDFRRNVGNYESATAGLKKFAEGMESTTRSSLALTRALIDGNDLMALFGGNVEENEERAKALQKVLLLLSIAEGLNNDVVKEGIAEGKLAVVTDGVRTLQIKAKTAAEAASTKGTIAATAAQKVFNAVASANPYVLLALAVAAVGTALFAFIRNTKDAATEQKRLNELQKEYIDAMSKEVEVTKSVADRRIERVEQEIRVLEAQGVPLEKIYKKEQEIFAIRQKSIERQKKQAGDAYKNLEKNKVELEGYTKLLTDLTKRQKEWNSATDAEVVIKVNGEATRMELDDAIEMVKGKIETLEGELTVPLRIETDESTLNADMQVAAEKARKEAENARKEAIEKAKEHAKEMAELRKQQADTELSEIRAAEDTYIALEEDAYKREREQTSTEYTRRIEDLQKRLDEEKTLTETAREAINEQIKNLTLKRQQELDRLEREYNAEQAQKNAEEIAARADLELQALDDMYAKIEKKKEKTTVRDNLGIIDVEATRSNLAAVETSLSEYIGGLISYQKTLKLSHEATLATLEEGTPEYEAALQQYAIVMEETSDRISDAQKRQEENTKKWQEVLMMSITDLMGKISEEINKYTEVISGVAGQFSSIVQIQLDALNEQLEAVDEKYEAARQRSEEVAEVVEETEERLRSASGGTAEALKEQLQEQVIAREEAAREERKLAKEKEKLEAQIAKKEKQQKKANLVSDIAQGIANTALGATRALELGFPLGLIAAGIVTAFGAVQTALMTKQLTKLEKGGEIKGPSHANGGVPIKVNGQYANEAQGGEFMINDKSYRANKSLVNFINDTPRTITGSDLIDIMPASTAPVIISDDLQSREDRIVEAIESIDMRPTVAVTDIIDASDQVVTVRDLAGF